MGKFTSIVLLLSNFQRKVNKSAETQHLFLTGEGRMCFLCSFCFSLLGKEAIKQVRDNPIETWKVEKTCLKHLFRNSEVGRLASDKGKYSLQ